MNSDSNDPASLERLHDIVLPIPAPWWPAAPAWYLLGGLLALFLCASVWTLIAIWRRNAYRRAGLAELERLESQLNHSDSMPKLAELVKRVALAAYPRERVASLTGNPWLSFL